MAKVLPLPDGTTVAIREGETPAQTWDRAQRMYPEAFGLSPAEESRAKQDTTGFKAAAAAGFERLKGESALTAAKLGLMGVTEAEDYQKQQQQKAAARFTPTEEGWTEAPFQKFKETLGGSLPYMAAPAAAGIAALAAPVAAPVAAGLGLAGAGVLSAGQFTGSNLARQMETGKSLEEASLGKAAAAAVPQALIDTAAMALLPGVGKLFGSVGSKLTTEQAKAIASQTLARTIGDYTAKTGMAMGREGVTEATQQLLERLQAGLNITDEDARKEYVESFIGGAVLGGAIAPVGRAFERGGAKRQAAQAERTEEQQRRTEQLQQQQAEKQAALAEEEARKSSPAYALDVDSRLEAVKAQIKELEAASSVTVAEGDIAAETAKKEAQKAKKALRNDPETKALIKEWNELNRAGRIDAAKEEQRVAGMSPEEYALYQAEQQKQVSGKQKIKPTEVGVADPFASIPPAPALTTQYAQERINLAKQQVPEQVAMAMQKGPAQDFNVYVDYLMADPYMASQLVKTRTPLPLLVEPQKNQEKQARDQKKAEEIVYDSLELKLADVNAARAAQIGQPNLQRLSTVEAEEQAALEVSRAADAAAAEEAARRMRMAPEMQALQRIRNAPSPLTQNLEMFKGEAAPPSASPAFAQLQQRLQGIPLGQGPLPTAEAVVPAEEAQRVLTRGEGKEFKLHPRSENTGAPITAENLTGRINRALTVFDLAPEAETFLRRAEQVIPQVDMTLKQATSGATNQGVRQNVSESQGFLTLLDQQLAKIESGEEGIPRKGAGRPEILKTFPPTKQTQAQVSATTPTEAFKKEEGIRSAIPGQAQSVSQAEMYAQRERLERTGKPGKLPGFVMQPEEAVRTQGVPGRAVVEKRGQDINPPVYRTDPVTGKQELVSGTIRGKSAQAVPLSLQRELEPLVRLSETVRDEQAGQLPLFGAADERSRVQKAERRGIEAGPSLDIGARPDVEGYTNYMNSPYVRKLRQDIQKPKKDLAPVRAFLGKALPRLKQMLQDSKATTARMSKIKNWTKFLKENQEVAAFQTNTENLALKINNTKLNVSDLDARIKSYEQAKERVVQEASKAGVRARGGQAEVEVLKELDDLIALHQEAKAEYVQAKAALDLMRTQMKVLVGEQRLAELKATVDPLAKSNAAAQDEIKRLQEVIRTAQAEVGEVETKERQAAADKAQATQGAKAGALQQVERQISNERARRLNVALSGFPEGVRVRALSAAERDARERGLTADAASEVKYKNDLYNKPLISLVLELGRIDEQLRETEKSVLAAKQKSKEYAGNVETVLPLTPELRASGHAMAFKGMMSAIRLQSNLSVRKETLEDAINFMRARNVPLREKIGAEPEVRSASIEEQDALDQYIDQVQELGKATDRLADLTAQRENAIRDGKTKTVERLNGEIDKVNTEISTGTEDKARLAVALQGRVSAGARQTTSAPAKFRTGTDESKRNVGSVKQPLVEQRTIKSPTVKQAVADANAYAEKIRAGQKDLTPAQEAAIEAERQAEFQYILERREAELTTKLNESTKELERLRAIDARPARENLVRPTEQEKTDLENEIKSFSKELAAVKRELTEQMRKMYRVDTTVVAEEVEAPEPKPRGRPRKVREEDVYGEDTRKTSAMEDVYSPREGEEYARGVESTSPDLTAAQIRALENNDLRAAFTDMANDPATSQVNRAVAQRLANMLDDTSVAIQDRVTDEDGKPVLGSATSRRINLSRNGGLSQEILLHEGTHAAVERVLQMPEGNLTKQQAVAKRELQALYAAIKADPKITSASAKGSISEFAAEVMSNRTLQQQLQGKKWRLSDAWAGFKSIIMRLLGVERPETMFGAALQSVDALMMPSSVRTKGVERTVSRKLAQKDIAALHTGSNSMKQFAEQFGPEIKQKDRTAEDANRIGKEMLEKMYDFPSDYIATPEPDKLAKNLKVTMSDGKPYDENTPLHYVEADAQTYINLAIQNNRNLARDYAQEIFLKRQKDLRQLAGELLEEPAYTYVEQALVAKAAAKYAVLSDKNGRLKLAEMGKDNTHHLAFVGSKDAGEVIRKLREGLPLKQAFLEGMQEVADRNAEKNANKNGWQKFDQNTVTPRPAIRITTYNQYGGVHADTVDDARGMVPAVPVGGQTRPVEPMSLAENLRRRASEVLMGRIEPGMLTEERANALPFHIPSFATPKPQRLVFVDKDKNVQVLSLTIAQHALLEHENARLDAEGEPRLHTIEEVSKFLTEYYDEIYRNVKPIDEAASELNAGAAGTSWCTGASVQTARNQIQQGDFYIYYQNGKPEVAVRMDGTNTIGEVRGNTESQGLTTEQEQIAKDFLTSTNFNGAQNYIKTLERKQSLLKILKGEVNPDFLMTLGPYVDIDGANETTVEMLLDFSSIDGEMFVRRPDPTKELLKATGDVLMDATEKVMADGYFPGMSAFINPYDNKAVFSYKGKKLEISADDLVAAGKLYMYSDEPTVLPNLKYVNAVELEDNAEVSLPQVDTIGLVEFKGNNNVQVLRLADNAVVGTVAVAPMMGAVRFAATKTRGIIKNATIIDNIETNDGNAALQLMLPDAIYAPVVSAKGNERIIADNNVEQFRKFIRELTYKYSIQKIDLDAEGADSPIATKYKKITEDVFGEDAVIFANESLGNYDRDTSLYDWLYFVSDYMASEQAAPKADIFKIAKKVNQAFDIANEAPRYQLVDSRANMGSVDAPKRIADKPPVLQLTEPEETPRYARAVQYGEDNALVDLSKDIMAKKKTWKEKLGTNPFLQTEMELVDMRAGLREALKAGAKEIGDDKLFTQAMSHVVMADQKMAMVNATLQKGPMELYTDEKGFYGVRSTDKNSGLAVFQSIADIPMGDAEAKANIATTYMIAQRALNKGVSKLDIGALGVTEEKLKAALAAANADPKLKDALENTRAAYNAYNEGQIKFLASTGAITKKEADRLLKEGDFVPFYRVNENGMAQLVFSDEVTVTIGDIRRQPYLEALKGGETRILPITETLQRNTLLLTDKALTNLATKNIAYAFQAIGAGKGPVGKDGKPTSAMPIKRGTGPASPDVIRFNQEPDPKDPDDDGKRWLRVKTGDTIMGGIPAELIVKSLEGAHLTLPAFLKAGGYAADILRSGVTRMPIYLARQLVRDPMAASFTGGLDYNPLTAVVKAGKEFIASSRGKSAINEEMIKKGLIQSGIFTGDPDDIAKMALQLAGGKDQGVIDKVFAAADRAAMRADAATRALVYENARRQGLSEVEADMAVRESMNFYKRGLSPTVQYASRLIPFFNAQIQGLNVLYKAATGQMPFEEQQKIKQKFFNNALLLVATGVVYAMAMDDDEYFRNAKPRDKYSNFFLHLPGVDEPLKLPIPYEAGWFFSMAVAAVDAMKAETDGVQQFQALRDMFLQSVPGYSSKFMPQIVKPAFEVWTNKSFFNDSSIESARMQKLTPEQRFSETTTEAAKALGKAVPILSPVQIEHIATGYFGQLPLIVMGAANGLFRKESRGEAAEKRVTDLPFIGSSFQKKYGGADTDVMYRLAEESMQAKATFDDLRKKGQAQGAKDFLEDNRALIASASLARNYQNVMSKLRADADRINNTERMSSAEKRARLDKIDEARQDVADKFEKAMKRIRDGGKT
jgi:hypothetical protein